MASNRHLGRIIALQTLYEAEFRMEATDDSFDLDAVLARNITRYKDMVDDVAFIKKLVAGVQKQSSVLLKTVHDFLSAPIFLQYQWQSPLHLNCILF